jgi:hypothetical protein
MAKDKPIIAKGRATLQGVRKWVSKCDSLRTLRSVQKKIKNRINYLTYKKPHNPLDYVDVSKKQAILSELIVNKST